MATDPDDYLGSDGEPSAAKMRAFIRLVVRESRRQWPGFRREERRNGTTMVAIEEEPVFQGAFWVSLRDGLACRVGDGTVNGIVPTIDEVPIDGLDEDGNPLPEGAPVLDLSAGPGPRSRSYVCLRVAIDPATGAPNPADPTAASIVHVPELPPGQHEGGSPDVAGAGLHVLAQMRWNADGSRITGKRQWNFFDQEHRFVAGQDGRPGRHFFRAVG